MTVLATSFDTYLALYDDFTRYADNVVMDGQRPIAGMNWRTAGATAPKISGGYLVSGTADSHQQIGYLYSIQPYPVNELGCDIVWSGGTQIVPAMTLTISADTTTLTLTKMLHFNFGPVGFNIALGDAVGLGAPLQSVTGGNWTVPMKNDNATVYRVKMAVRGNSLAVFGPNGEVFGWTDARVSQFAGGLCFLEPGTYFEGSTAGLTAKVKRAWAVSSGSTNPTGELGTSPTSPFAANGDVAALGSYFYYGRVVGALNRMGEVDVGVISESPGISFPQVQFGPTNIITSLAAASVAGATTISTVDYIPVGPISVTIDPGPNQEVVTVSAVSHTFPPYQLTVPALAKAHASGAIVQCTAADTMRYTVVYNQIAATLQFPIDERAVSFGDYSFQGSVFLPLGPGFYLDKDYQSRIKYSNGAVRLAPANAFTTGLSTTANRPNAATVGAGAQFYDTTLNKPIWSTGAAWHDAAGNLV